MSCTAAAPTGYLTATDLARFHVHLCKKLLWLANNNRRSTQRPTAPLSSNPLASARFSKGNKWEDHLKATLLRQGLLLRAPASIATASDLIQLVLADGRSHFYVVDLSFDAPRFDRELASRGLAADAVRFGVFKPDFLEINVDLDGNAAVKFRWRVIDAKASRRVKISHQVQIGFYVICLKRMFSDWQEEGSDVISASVQIAADDVGVVWIPPTTADRDEALPAPGGEFSLPMLQPLLETFLFSDVPRTLSQELSQVPWHFNPLCQGCDFVERCERETLEQRMLGNVPGLSLPDAAFLKEAVAAAGCGRGEIDLEDLHRLVHGTDGLARLRSSQRARASRLLNLVPARAAPMQPQQDLRTCSLSESSVLRAAVSKTVQPTLRRCLYLPRSEDVAVALSIGIDPETDFLFAYSILAVRRNASPPDDAPILSVQQTSANGETAAERFVHDLAGLIKALQEDDGDPAPQRQQQQQQARVQFYVFSRAEHAALTAVLVSLATAASAPSHPTHESTRLCIGALLDHSDVLLTAVQPELLSARLLVRSRAGMRKAEMQTLLRIFGGRGVDVRGTNDALKARLDAILGKNAGRPAARDAAAAGLTRLVPRVAVVAECVRDAIDMPVPGWFGVGDCVRLLVPGRGGEDAGVGGGARADDVWFDAYSAFKSNDAEAVERIGEAHSRDVLAVVDALRARVRDACRDARMEVDALLPNVGREFEVVFIDVVQDPDIKRLLFIIQFEIMQQLTSLTNSRVHAVKTTHLRYIHPVPESSSHVFEILSGAEHLEVPAATAPDSSALCVRRGMYACLLAVAGSDSALAFDDLRYAADYGPKVAGGDDWAVAEVGWRDDDENRIVVKVRGARGLLKPGREYVLSTRMVDFNSSKLVKTLLTIDLRMQDCRAAGIPPPFFAQLLCGDPAIDEPLAGSVLDADNDTERRVQRFYREQYDLANRERRERALLFVGSQHTAFRRVLARRVSVVWGPPGHGKTHTLALTALRLIELAGRRGSGSAFADAPFRVLVTASTNTAVETLVAKFNALLVHAREIENMGRGEWRAAAEGKLLPKDRNAMPRPETLPAFAVVGATAWGVFSWREKHPDLGDAFSALIIDEGSQMTVAEAAIPIDCIMGAPQQGGRGGDTTKRLIVAGDHMQLAPVLHGGPYPRSQGRLFGSVLEWLADTVATPSDVGQPGGDVQDGRMDMLKENFRMVRDLCGFTNTLYKAGGRFTPMRDDAGGQDGLTAAAATSSASPPVLDLTPIDPNCTLPPTLRPRNAIVIPASHADLAAQLEAEARAVVRLLTQLRDVDGLDLSAPGQAMVVTPHRAQRATIRRALAAELGGRPSSAVVVDTVERIQGGEAAAVIVCFGFCGCAAYHDATLAFTYHLPRLNVALSRARDRCFLLCTRELLLPPLGVAGSAETRGALAHLWGFLAGAAIVRWVEEAPPLVVRPGGSDGGDGEEEDEFGYSPVDEEELSRMMAALGVV
ncbi:hypothetical protein HDU87_001289 [Geranomyces variabilis]|uniref:DNA2/NAM7 helicase-like C-terminal domain-containing protein n=1 Tax=Geranomyces variabilis TaxID=109894 RepID=A0AAD5XSM3_9FUNG|nr:hypothetical protein HDU87_001289 [Geranomyces variabilis]